MNLQSRVEKLEAVHRPTREEKYRRLMELIASGFIRQDGCEPRDLARLSENELLRIIGTDKANYDAAMTMFAGASRNRRAQ